MASPRFQIWQDRLASVRQGGMAAIVETVLQRWFTADFHKTHPETIAGYRNILLRTPAAGYIGCSLAIRDADLYSDAARISSRRWWWWAKATWRRRPKPAGRSRKPSKARSWSN